MHPWTKKLSEAHEVSTKGNAIYKNAVEMNMKYLIDRIFANLEL